MMNERNVDIATLSFEQALQELEALVRSLEEGKTTLDQTVETYERGVALKSHCESLLKAAKLRVEKITVGASPEGTLSAVSVSPSSL